MISSLKIQSEKVYYKSFNSGAKTLLLIHGLAIDSTIWEQVIPRLKNYKVICLDLAGYGLNNNHSGLPDVKSQAKFLNNFIKVIGHIDCLTGYSFGGRVAYEYFKLYKPDIEHIIIIAAPFFNTASMRLNGIFLNLLAGSSFIANRAFYIATSLPVLRFILKNWQLTDSKNTKIVNYTSAKLRSGKDYSKFIRNLASVTRLSENFPIESVSTLDYIYGDKDGGATLKEVKEMIRLDNLGNLIVIKNTYHLIPLEAPQEVASIIKNII